MIKTVQQINKYKLLQHIKFTCYNLIPEVKFTTIIIVNYLQVAPFYFNYLQAMISLLNPDLDYSHLQAVCCYVFQELLI